jgi:peptidoglycan hydrolase CwlO-like protein
MIETGFAKSKTIDVAVSSLASKIDASQKKLATDQKELKRIDTEIALMQAKIDKCNLSLEQKKKLKEETLIKLKEYEGLFMEVIK